MRTIISYFSMGFVLFAQTCHAAAIDEVHADIDRKAAQVLPRVIEWRRDFHQHPELPNREFRTAEIIARHLKALNIDVKTGVAGTGVVATLYGAKPGPVVALRADMDGGIGNDNAKLPYASRVESEFMGKKVVLAHLLGHDAHTAILMGVAETLAQMRSNLPGTVKFIFQPAEGLSLLPPGEEGGAELMIKEGALENPTPSAIFGLHVGDYPAGSIHYRSGAVLASQHRLKVLIKGRPAFAAAPWLGRDPLPVAAHILLALQDITARQSDMTHAPALISIGALHSGEFYNRTAATASMDGTIRLLDKTMESEIFARIRQTVSGFAAGNDLGAEVDIQPVVPLTNNDPELVEDMLPTLRRSGLAGSVSVMDSSFGAENFGFFSQKIPGFYFVLGVRAPEAENVGDIDEGSLVVGVKALASLAYDYLDRHRAQD